MERVNAELKGKNTQYVMHMGLWQQEFILLWKVTEMPWDDAVQGWEWGSMIFEGPFCEASSVILMSPP